MRPVKNSFKKWRSDKVLAFLSEARDRHDRAETSEADNRRMGLDDLRFYNGDHWPDWIARERDHPDNPRIRITVNKFPTLVKQVTNDARQNRPMINISPDGEGAEVEVARMMRGYIRKVQRLPESEIALDTSLEGACRNGWGYFRLATEFEHTGKTFNQVLVFKRIRNPFTVHLDDLSQDPTGGDAKWGFVSELMPKDEFKAKWPKAKANSFEWGTATHGIRWQTADHIRVAEYWVVETEDDELLALKDGFVAFRSELDEVRLKEVTDDPDSLQNRRPYQRTSVKCYKITGCDILDEYEWLGDCIPIIRVTGDETDIQGKVTWSGIIRHAKDSARMYDFWVTAGTEQVALASRAPYIAEEGQLENHTKEWDQANRLNLPYLLYKGVSVAGRPAPVPQRQAFAGVPSGILAMQEASAQDMLGTTGIRFDATKQERVNEESGIALEHLKRNTELGSFHYNDNLARALKQAGHIFLDVVPKLADEARIVSIIGDDDKEEKVMLDTRQREPVRQVDGENGTKMRSFNPSMGRYSAAVSVGPSYLTKRKEAAAGQVELAKALGPDHARVIADLIAKNQDWDDAEEVSRRFAFMLPPGMLQPPMVGVPPQVQAMLAQMQTQIQQLSMEKEELIKIASEKRTDQRIDIYKIEKDFEAKYLKVFADMEKALLDKVDSKLAMAHEFAMRAAETELPDANEAQPGTAPAQPALGMQGTGTPPVNGGAGQAMPAADGTGAEPSGVVYQGVKPWNQQ